MIINLGPIMYFVLGLYALAAVVVFVPVYFILRRVVRGLKSRRALPEMGKAPLLVVGGSQGSRAFGLRADEQGNLALGN